MPHFITFVCLFVMLNFFLFICSLGLYFTLPRFMGQNENEDSTDLTANSVSSPTHSSESSSNHNPLPPNNNLIISGKDHMILSQEAHHHSDILRFLQEEHASSYFLSQSIPLSKKCVLFIIFFMDNFKMYTPEIYLDVLEKIIPISLNNTFDLINKGSFDLDISFSLASFLSKTFFNLLSAGNVNLNLQSSISSSFSNDPLSFLG